MVEVETSIPVFPGLVFISLLFISDALLFCQIKTGCSVLSRLVAAHRD